MRGRAAGLAGLLLAGSVAAPAVAQDYGGFARRGTPGDFDFYVLALSWSPTYCAGPGARRDDVQCAPGRGLGFVVHGLWPQYASGYPQNCSAVNRAPTRQAMEVAGQVYPSEGLARYEWRKHGTCSGLDPAAYFAAARAARLSVTIPDALKGGAPPQSLAPIEIARQFVTANRGLRPDMMAVTCTRGQLQEVRICFGKDLRGFTPCPEVARGNCRAPEVSLDAAR
ncbi:ribonuclease T2 family protein [Methylobacterium radiotolerans]|uniref:Ribonuclease T2 n=2 Tax=Methylobacterium radiotolerans TaxID=31998 RepID=B1LXQ4_METRJ|nr:ribonuclease T2 [Methylobacterium radiotolerans]ACB24261.1 ribonuclease T2 [Methylobacterium radiotolerans JCM 2831]